MRTLEGANQLSYKALGHVEYSKPTTIAIMTTYYFLRVGPITSLKLIDRNIIVISKYIKL